MYRVPVDKKVCATCKWWRGKRELAFVGAREPKFIEVEGIMPKGCLCQAWRVERSSMHHCDRWSQWERM